MKRVLRPAGLVALLTAAVLIAAAVHVPGASDLRTRFGGTGLSGLLLFGALYAALALLPLPLSVLTIAAGAVFGLGGGVAVVIGGATLGATGSFWIGRLLGRDTVQRRFTGRRMEAVDDLLRDRGLLAVIGVRLVPLLPFTAVNYLSGLTAVRFPSYVLGTAIGIVPGTTAYVAVGAYGHRPGSWPFLGALAALGVLSIGGVVAARRRRRVSVTACDDDAAPATT